MNRILLAAAFSFGAVPALAAPETYELDPSHSQVVFSFVHFGFSTTYNTFAGVEGKITFDQDDPASSAVEVAFPVRSMFTGWEKRFEHFMSDDFFGAGEDDMIRFVSTGIEVTGDTTAEITGDLTVNDVTKPVTLDAKLNLTGVSPINQKEYAGFDATATIKRSDFELGAFAPAVSDELEVLISIEAFKPE